jgi:hypothetical protein
MYKFFEKYQPKTDLLYKFFNEKFIQDEFGERIILKPIR